MATKKKAKKKSAKKKTKKKTKKKRIAQAIVVSFCPVDGARLFPDRTCPTSGCPFEEQAVPAMG